MSWAALEWARKQKCGKSGRKFCLIMLANYADESGTCYPGVEKLAADMEAGVSTVHTYLADLEKQGLLRVLVRYGKRGSRRSNRYQLLLEGAETALPESDDWHYERPDSEARKVHGRRKPPESGDLPDQGDHASDFGSDADQASRIGSHETPGSGDTSLQDRETTSNKELNRQLEPPVGTASSVPATQERPAQQRVAQATIDGTEETLGAKEPTTTDTAFGIANGWIKYRADSGKPIAGARLEHRIKSLVLPFLDAGYTEKEIKTALAGLAEGVPSAAAMQRALGTIRDRQQPGAGGHPQQNGRGGGVMAGTNRHLDDITEEERRARNPLNSAVAASQFTGERQGAAA